MTDRVVKIVLRGQVADFVGGMRAASSAARATTASITDGSRESAKYRGNLTALGNTAGKVGLVAAAGVGLAVRAFANFDQAMSHVAATGADAQRSIDALREAAIKAGARTVYSATEAANAIEELAKAGVSAQDILSGGLDAALDLAAAGGLAVADAATIAATTLNQFGLAGTDAEHVADLLASAANSAQGSVSDVGEAMKYVGPVAHQMGVSLEETTGTIAELASQGILAGNAGTALRGVLSALTSPSKIASNTMEELGINVYDASGNFVGFRGVAEQLHTTLGGLTNAERDQALGRIFGNEQITAARILYSGGAAAVDKWSKAVNQSGAAQEQAAKRLDNLSGDFEQLKGSLDTALIGTGSGANGPLRETVQLLTGLVNAYNSLPGPIKTTILAGAGLTAALGGSAFVISRAISGYSDLRKNLSDVSGSFENVNRKALALRGGAAAAGIALAALSKPAHDVDEDLGTLTDIASAAALGFAAGGPWGAAIGGGIALLSSLGGESTKTKDMIAGLTDTLDEQTGAVTKNTASWVGKELQDSGAASALSDLGISLATATDAALGNADALDKVKAALGEVKDNGPLRDNYSENRTALETVLNLADGLKEGTKSTKELAAAQKDSVVSSKITSDATAKLTEEQQKFNDSNGKVAASFIDVSQGANDAKVSLHDYISQLAAQATALNDFAKNARTASKRGLEEGLIQDLQHLGPEGALRLKQLADSSDSELDRANRAYRKGQKAIANYHSAFDEIPKSVDTSVNVKDDAALKSIRSIRSSLGKLDGFVADVFLTTHKKTVASGDDKGNAARGSSDRATGGAVGRADGGSVVGAGTGTSDSIPAIGPGGQPYRLSNGEHVMTANEVDILGGQDRVYAMRAAIRSRQFAFASGGGVTAQSGPTSIDLNATAIAPAIGAAVKSALYGTSFQILPDGSVRAKQMGA